MEKKIGFCSGCGMPLDKGLIKKLQSDQLAYCDHCGKEILLPETKPKDEMSEVTQISESKSVTSEFLREKLEDTIEKARDANEKAISSTEDAIKAEAKLEILKIEYEEGKTTNSFDLQEKLIKKIKKQKLKLVKKKKRAKINRKKEQNVKDLLLELKKQAENEQIEPKTKKSFERRIDNWVENINKSVENILGNVSQSLESETGKPLQKIIKKYASKEDLMEMQKLGIISQNSGELTESTELKEEAILPENSEVFSQPFNAYRGEEPFVFVSYSHNDKKLVYSDIERLHNDGFKIWYDEGIPLSTTWNDEVAKSVKYCSCFLVFLSNQSIKSKNVQNEINFALKYDKKIVPIYLDDAVLPGGLELQLVSIQGIYKYKMTDQQYYDKVRSDLTGILK